MSNNASAIFLNDQNGIPVFTNTTIPVQTFIDYLKGGKSVEIFLHDFPNVKRDQILDFLELMEQILMSTLIPSDKAPSIVNKFSGIIKLNQHFDVKEAYIEYLEKKYQ